MKVIRISAGILAAITLSACGTRQVTECTIEPENTWIAQGVFQERLRAEGYQIDTFKITAGNCYQVNGQNASQQKVEILFSPIDGSIVKQ